MARKFEFFVRRGTVIAHQNSSDVYTTTTTVNGVPSRVDRTVVHNTDFWIREPSGKEVSCELSDAKIPMNEGQDVTILYLRRPGDDSGKTCAVSNATAATYWTTRSGVYWGRLFGYLNSAFKHFVLGIFLGFVAWMLFEAGTLSEEGAYWGMFGVSTGYFVLGWLMTNIDNARFGQALGLHINQLAAALPASTQPLGELPDFVYNKKPLSSKLAAIVLLAGTLGLGHSTGILQLFSEGALNLVGQSLYSVKDEHANMLHDAVAHMAGKVNKKTTYSEYAERANSLAFTTREGSLSGMKIQTHEPWRQDPFMLSETKSGRYAMYRSTLLINQVLNQLGYSPAALNKAFSTASRRLPMLYNAHVEMLGATLEHMAIKEGIRTGSGLSLEKAVEKVREWRKILASHNLKVNAFLLD